MPEYAADRPTSVRRGEELDRERLREFLADLFPGEGDEVEVEQFPSGFSNLTYAVRFGGREMVLRRPPFGSKVRSAHDMGREFRILSRLAKRYAKVPEPIAYCDDERVLGAPFYLMDRVRGLILRGSLAPAEAPEPEVMRAVAGSLVDALVELHELDFEALGLDDFGRPEGYVQRQVEGWAGRYERARTDELADLDRAGAWLVAERPAESGAALIHNDFKHDNVVLDVAAPERILAILDWEMATLGDPLLDLGTTLAYWVDPGDPPPLLALRLTPTTLPGCPPRAAIARLYAERSGRPIGREALVYGYVFGLFKIAVIVQQIYYRYLRGHTSDARFAGLIDAVRALGWAACRAIELGRIDRLAE